MSYREELQKVLPHSGIIDIIDIQRQDWGDYDIKNLTRLQKEYLKADLSDIIKESLSFLKEEVTDKDISDYNDMKMFGFHIDKCLEAVAEVGNVKLVRYYLSQGATSYTESIMRASERGHLEIVLIILKRLDKRYSLSMKYFINDKKMVESTRRRRVHEYNLFMIEAVSGGHIDVVKLMLLLGANDYNKALNEAKKKGYSEIEKLIEK